MVKLSEIVARYKNKSQASIALMVAPTQLDRWLKNDAYIDEFGCPYIKTKGKINLKGE